jgi:hypothetical protein
MTSELPVCTTCKLACVEVLDPGGDHAWFQCPTCHGWPYIQTDWRVRFPAAREAPPATAAADPPSTPAPSTN